jgi:hypothetical protein
MLYQWRRSPSYPNSRSSLDPTAGLEVRRRNIFDPKYLRKRLVFQNDLLSWLCSSEFVFKQRVSFGFVILPIISAAFIMACKNSSVPATVLKTNLPQVTIKVRRMVVMWAKGITHMWECTQPIPIAQFYIICVLSTERKWGVVLQFRI